MEEAAAGSSERKRVRHDIGHFGQTSHPILIDYLINNFSTFHLIWSAVVRSSTVVPTAIPNLLQAFVLIRRLPLFLECSVWR